MEKIKAVEKRKSLYPIKVTKSENKIKINPHLEMSFLEHQKRCQYQKV